jgi:hypothetical protein
MQIKNSKLRKQISLARKKVQQIWLCSLRVKLRHIAPVCVQA